MEARARAFRTALFAIFSGIGVAACAHARNVNPASSTEPTSATFELDVEGPDGAAAAEPFGAVPLEEDPNAPANRTGAAACDRAAECDAVGIGKEHTSREGCLARVRRSADRWFEGLSCDNGLDDARLTECIAAVRNAPCGEVAAMGKLGVCSSSRLCAR